MNRHQSFSRFTLAAMATTVAVAVSTSLVIGSAAACPPITMDPVTGAPSTQSDLQAALDALTAPVTMADATH
jgi:hypothetical protein